MKLKTTSSSSHGSGSCWEFEIEIHKNVSQDLGKLPIVIKLKPIHAELCSETYCSNVCMV